MQVEGTSVRTSLFPSLPHSQDDTWCFLCFLGFLDTLTSKGGESDTWQPNETQHFTGFKTQTETFGIIPATKTYKLLKLSHFQTFQYGNMSYFTLN